MSTPSSRQSAKALVEQIAKDHGYLGKEKLQQIPSPELRREIEEAFLKKDLMIGSTVITLAKNLYTSKARFVFELLQNADDNRFDRAKELRSIPYVSFRVYPRKIVLECNEDGFNRDNLVAICSVGKSSKSGKAGAQGYIGEKGIGFKSVFMAAWQAHIQSGNFSFSFTHRNGDSGMGMISPEWVDSEDQPDPPLTRITLHLHETGDADVLKKTRETIHEQFEELEETILLFMKSLRRINVGFYNEDGNETSSTTYSIKRPRASYAILERTKTINGATQTRIKHFHVTTHEATNLAKNENRTYSQEEEVSRAYSKSEITLAFPLSENSIPIIEPQNLFVFLPVRPVGFRFLIQADFVTDASRQDIVRDSLRNSRLIDGIADAFIKAVLQFCQHDTLRYQWMRYLPDKNSANWTGLWLALVNQIAGGLAQAAVLYGQKRTDARPIKDLIRLRNDHLDENGDPLFEDIEPEQIISQRYKISDLNILGDYGLGYANSWHVFEWLKKDLSQSRQSRMKSPTTPDSWHTKVAKLLLKIIRAEYYKKATLKYFDILPLEDTTWTSISTGPAYFGRSAGLDIPPGTRMRLISKVVTNYHRRSLFEDLGVVTAPPALVREKILDRYSRVLGPIADIGFETSKKHLEFLYLTEHLKSNLERTYTSARLAIHDATCRLYQPYDLEMYIENAEPCGARELFKRTSSGPSPGDGAPGYPALFVHRDYFKDGPAAPDRQKLTWLDWFIQSLHVLTVVRFDSQLPGHLAIDKYLREHRPEKYLSAVQVFYQHYGGAISLDFKQRLPNVDVLCRGNRRVQLKDSYLPTNELESLVEQFVEPNAFFPWLLIPKDDTQHIVTSERQKFFSDIGVGSPPTALDFALDMLRYSLDAFPDDTANSSRARLFELYYHIELKYRESRHKDSAQRKIRGMFSTRQCIYIPLGRNRHKWSFPSSCVWDAPQEMRTKHALRLLYEPLFRLDNVDGSYLTGFFKDSLGISDCSREDLVEELKSLKLSNCGDSDMITNIYVRLNDLRQGIFGISKDHLLNAFEMNALIYVPADDGPAWHKVSQCVWSSAARLRGRVSLNDDYEDLKDFFVDFLGVKMVDITMAIDELKEAGSRQSTSIQEIKESIWTVNSLLSTTSEPPKPDQVLKSRIFPIRLPSGTCSLGSLTTEFFVVDREKLSQSFKTKVKFLDFTLEEVVRLGPFLNWTHLEARYLSHCVKEITSFHGGIARLTSNPNRQIGNRAHPLLRIANHFNSPRTKTRREAEAFYRLLRSAEICETDGISSDLRLLQDGTSHEVEVTRISLHIDEEVSGLKIYLPRNKDAQEHAFATLLSLKLFDWMMRDPTTQIPVGNDKDGVKATRDILVTPRSTIYLALEDNGIAPTDIADVDEKIPLELDAPSTPRGGVENESPGSSLGDEGDSDADNLETPTSSVMSPPSDRRGAIFPNRSSLYTPTRPSLGHGDPFVLASPSPSPTPTSQTQFVADQQKYIDLLGRVISSARRSTFPSSGPFEMSQLLSSLAAADTAPDFGLRSANQIERDCKIGAAGELYVFELLLHLIEDRQLPGFSRENWQSTIRKYVTVHPQYAEMTPWNGRETSDITYTDLESVLTDFLIDKGYLARDEWTGKTPKYFIEVKTTTLACNTQLYMSKAQYRRMQENTITAENRDTIYVIFRVFNLGRDDMGLKVYLDPEALRLSNHLVFTPESWTVIPRPVS